MKHLKILFVFSVFFSIQSKAQTPKVLYAEIGGPGIASVNFDTRFSKNEDGLGGRIGIGGFSLHDDLDNSRVGIFTIPVGLNYLLGKDGKNYFELGAGFTYIGGSSRDDFSSETFNSSFGNLTLGYRLAPAKGGFTFKAQITPVFGKGFFVPYYAGLGFGYKF
ncbi:MAG: hypothetical protein ACTHOB_14205 [Ginsengibacter sp.]